MRKLLFIVLIGSLAFFGCKKVKDLLRFDLSYATAFTIPGNQSIINTLLPPIFSPTVSANSEQTFKNEGTSANLVKEIKMKKVMLTITSPSGQTFQFLKSITVYIAKGDGSSPKRIAYKTEVPSNVGNTLTLDVDQSVLLDEYIKADQFKLKTEYTIKGTNPDVDVNADLVFNVLADPL